MNTSDNFDKIKKYLKESIEKYGYDISKIYRSSTKEMKDLIKEVTSHLDPSAKYQERIYNILNDKIDKTCKYGNTKKFRDVETGYTRFCKSNCKCNKEYFIELQKTIHQNRTKEEEEIKKQKSLDALEKQRQWIPDNPKDFNFKDLKDYINERMETCKDRQSVVIKTLPYFIEEQLIKHTSYLDDDDDVTPMERIYNIINPGKQKICGCGNKTHFYTFNRGYTEFCGPDSKCLAKRQKQSEFMKEAQNNLTPEEKERRNQKSKETSLKNWGVESHTQKHISKEALDILNDPEKLVELYKKEGISHTSEKLGVSASNIFNKLRYYGYKADTKNVGENEIYQYLKDLGVENIKRNTRPLDGKEIDILCEDTRIGFEFNGIYWHSTKFKDKDYHSDKNDIASNKGYDISHIFEDELYEKNYIIKNLIERKVGKSKNKISNAKFLEIDQVSKTTTRKFMNENHLDSYKEARYHYGAFKIDCVVSIMSFSEIIKGKTEIIQFASDRIVIDDIKNILDKFIKDTKVKEIEIVLDMRWDFSKEFLDYGFVFVEDIPPKAMYFHKEKRIDWDVTVENLISAFDLDESYKNKTLDELISHTGIMIVYDCGYKRLRWKNKSK